MFNVDSTIKVLKKVDVTDLAGEKVMIDFETGKYYMIKGVGNDIFDMLDDGVQVKTIVDRLLGEYEVDEQTCTSSAIDFLNHLESVGFIESINA